MKKVYRMKNLECANCAAKMERAIQKIKGVQSATMSFMAQKLTIECEDDHLQEIMEQAQACVKKVEPDAEILGV